MAQAKAIAAECTDPRLKADVLAMAQATATWSTQLKIISAVKAASGLPHFFLWIIANILF